MSFIYLATAYSHPDRAVRHDRYLEAVNIVARHLEANRTIYSPVVHYHPAAELHNLAPGFTFWSKHNYAMLAKASEMWILNTEAAQTSLGVQAEYDFARSCGIPIFVLNSVHSTPSPLTRHLFD